jgi:AcrR family transcriptional regulator
MSLRELAGEVGMQPGSLYKYFKNKEGLLFDIMKAHMDELLEQMEDALAEVVGAEARLLAFAAFHLRYHRTRHKELHIANAELRSLGPEARAEIVALRKRYEQILQDILQSGVQEQVFSLRDIRITAFAILAMLTGIGAWYDPQGRVPLEEIVQIHLELMTDGVRPSGVSRPLKQAQALAV